VGDVSELGRCTFLFYFKGTPSWIYKNVLPPLGRKLLVMWERIGEALKMVVSATLEQYLSTHLSFRWTIPLSISTAFEL
jgi:hypothetical protein